MSEPENERMPWEVPPDEEYWQALLREGEYGEGASAAVEPDEQGAEATPAPSVPQQPAKATPGPSVSQQVAEPEALPRAACWDAFLEYLSEGKPVDLRVVNCNRGGLLVQWEGVMGFVPASQLCEGIPSEDELSRREMLNRQVGRTLTLKVIEVDPSKGRLILSERAAQRGRSQSDALLEALQPGDVRHGSITNLCTFGAFVDLGGVEGLIHISEISWARVGHPGDVLRSGQEVDVYVLNVDRQERRVGLSLKRLQPDPWGTVEDRYQIGQVVQGTVTSLAKFGAFVRIANGLEGLIHASEFADGSAVQGGMLREGDVVQVRITAIEAARHRISLSLG